MRYIFRYCLVSLSLAFAVSFSDAADISPIHALSSRDVIMAARGSGKPKTALIISYEKTNQAPNQAADGSPSTSRQIDSVVLTIAKDFTHVRINDGNVVLDKKLQRVFYFNEGDSQFLNTRPFAVYDFLLREASFRSHQARMIKKLHKEQGGGFDLPIAKRVWEEAYLGVRTLGELPIELAHETSADKTIFTYENDKIAELALSRTKLSKAQVRAFRRGLRFIVNVPPDVSEWLAKKRRVPQSLAVAQDGLTPARSRLELVSVERKKVKFPDLPSTPRLPERLKPIQQAVLEAIDATRPPPITDEKMLKEEAEYNLANQRGYHAYFMFTELAFNLPTNANKELVSVSRGQCDKFRKDVERQSACRVFHRLFTYAFRDNEETRRYHAVTRSTNMSIDDKLQWMKELEASGALDGVPRLYLHNVNVANEISNFLAKGGTLEVTKKNTLFATASGFFEQALIEQPYRANSYWDYGAFLRAQFYPEEAWVLFDLGLAAGLKHQNGYLLDGVGRIEADLGGFFSSEFQ